MNRLVFVNRFYWPDHAATGQLLTDLARDQAARGRDVLVITSSPGASASAQESDAGVRILRVRSRRSRSRSMFSKAFDFLSFFVAATWRIHRLVRQGDTLVVLTDPPLLSIPATWIARRRGAKVVHWVQDIYPEVASAVTGHRAPLLLRYWRNTAWRRASQCVTLSHEMAAVLTANGVSPDRVTVIPNWAPQGLVALPQTEASCRRLRSGWGAAGKFVVGYSGNLGRVHDLAPVLEAAAQLRDQSDIVFIFVGGGANERLLRDQVKLRGITNVRFVPPVAREQLSAALGAIDLHLVTLRTGCEQYVYPSKVYGIVTVGRPMVFIGPAHCELAGQVRDHHLGLAASRDDTDGIVAAITTLARDRATYDHCAAAALRYAATNSVQAALDRWHASLAQSDLAE